MSEKNSDTEFYYWEKGFMVFTEAYHLKRGYCCKNGCRHCPYEFRKNNVKQKVTMSWSGGKDSALALYKILLSGLYEVVSLHTIINEETHRVGMHGVPETLIDQQAEIIGIPLHKIYLESSESHTAYEILIRSFYRQCTNAGISAVVFGDIFLEDLKKYREELIRESRLLPVFPLWKINSSVLINDFINLGFKTLICAANTKFFHHDQLGKTIDQQFIRALPAEVDPCGENGEFHTFVYDGPLFKKQVAHQLGEVIIKRYLYRQQNADGSITKFETDFLFQEVLSQIA